MSRLKGSNTTSRFENMVEPELQEKMDRINSELIKDDSQELADYILSDVIQHWYDFRVSEGLSVLMQ